MNNYARLPHVRNELNAKGSTAQDTDIVRAIDQASSAARSEIGGRQFHSTIETRTFDGRKILPATSGPVLGRIAGFYGDFGHSSMTGIKRWDLRRLYLNGSDLISITALTVDTDGDGVFETTLAAGTDYVLWPYNAAGQNTPYRAIDLVPNGGQLLVWPVGEYLVRIAGTWGYCDTWEVVVSAGVAVTGSLADAGADLTITPSVDPTDLICAGDTIKMESEQMEVLAVLASSITVTRAINGTTGAAHSSKAISLRRYPADIERAVAADAARYLWRASQGYPEGGFREQWAAIRDTLSNYMDPAGVF